MKTCPEVTVLTAVHNGARHLAQTIDCIQRQTFTDWEYLIVDDASEDATVEVAEAAAKRDPRIRVLRRDVSEGPYVAANDGLRVAEGTYVVRIDADDLSPAHRIERQLGFLRDNRDFRACVSFWQPVDESGAMAGGVVTIPVRPRVFCWHLLLRAPSIHSSACFERSAIEELGGYRGLRLSQDYRLWCELSRRGWLGIIPEVLSYVRFHGRRASHTATALQRDLALDVLADHLAALAGRSWAREDVVALWSAGMSHLMPVRQGLAILERWERLWQADPELDAEDRAELAHLAAYRKWKHLRSNLRRQPTRVLVDAVKLGIVCPGSLVEMWRALQ